MPTSLRVARTPPDPHAHVPMLRARPRGGRRLVATGRALQAWMASEGPWSLDLTAYEVWAERENAERRPDQRFYPSASEVLDERGEAWRELVRTKVRGVERCEPARPDLASVRSWLTTRPAHPTRAAYAAWARARRAEGTWHASPDALQRSERMTWFEVLAAAGVDAPGSDRRQVRVRPYEPRLADGPAAGPTASDAGPLDGIVLLSDGEVVRRLPRLSSKRALHNGSLGLTPALSVVGVSFFHATDVDALLGDRAIPRRQPYELSELVMHSGQVAAVLRLSRSAVRMYIKRERWSLVPRPAVRTQGFETWLWLRSDVDRFLDGRPHRDVSDAVPHPA